MVPARWSAISSTYARTLWSGTSTPGRPRVPGPKAPTSCWTFERLISRSLPRPFFAWVNFRDPHSPYLRREDGVPIEDAVVVDSLMPEDASVPTTALSEAYDDEVRFVDLYVGRVVDLLRDRGILDDTIVVLTSDHGEEFEDHFAEARLASATMLGRFHGHSLYSELLHVPLIVRYPPRVPPGTRIANLVRHPIDCWACWNGGGRRWDRWFPLHRPGTPKLSRCYGLWVMSSRAHSQADIRKPSRRHDRPIRTRAGLPSDAGGVERRPRERPTSSGPDPHDSHDPTGVDSPHTRPRGSRGRDRRGARLTGGGTAESPCHASPQSPVVDLGRPGAGQDSPSAGACLPGVVRRIGHRRPRDLDRLVRGASVVHVEPKHMDVLVLLAEQPGHVLSKGEILSSVWKDQFVADSVLTRAIAELRRKTATTLRRPASSRPSPGGVTAWSLRCHDQAHATRIHAKRPSSPRQQVIADATGTCCPWHWW
ncbi:MAG: sulfatase-like hydrolase/transferase [bacterium]|nr:sulfatase-like hydrolase/transferase [bacterium]MCP5066615.1 sulfatase-like hydrolase/transferase [bacterium]